MGGGPVSFAYVDEVVNTELRLHPYPYGGGYEGTGVQVTVESKHLKATLAIRLPQDDARRMALAILDAVEGRERSPDHTVDVSGCAYCGHTGAHHHGSLGDGDMVCDLCPLGICAKPS